MHHLRNCLCVVLFLIFQLQTAVATELPAEASARIDTLLNELEVTPAQRVAAKNIIAAGLKERLDIMRQAGIAEGNKPGAFTLMRIRTPLQRSYEKTEQQLANVFDAGQMLLYKQKIEQIRNDMRKKLLGP